MTLTLVGLFVAAILIGIYAVVLGGTLFLSLPLFQILFPHLPFATIIGTIKVGSVIRNARAVQVQRHVIELRTLWLLIPLGIGSALGAYFVTEMHAWVVPAVLVAGLALSEWSGRIVPTNQTLLIVALAVGFYGGILGAGIMLLLLALLQVRFANTADARANALMLEMLVSLIAVLVYILAGHIDLLIAAVWAAGGYVGGQLGGIINQRTGTLAKQKQQWLVRISFGIALIVAIWKL